MNNFVISMINADERRQHIEKEFGKNEISFSFFDAISKENQLDFYTENLLPKINETNLTIGEKGCLLSHLALWEKCINEDFPYITIFEDDVILSNNSKLFLNDEKWMNNILAENNKFILRLETFLMPIEQEKTHIQLEKSQEDYKLVNLKSVHFGTAGYIITQSLAKILLQKIKSEDSLLIEAIDNWLFHNDFFKNNCYDIYQLSPAICIQELQYKKEHSMLHSSIESERKIRDKKLQPQKNIHQRIKKIIFNFHRILTKLKHKKNVSSNNINNIILFK